MDTIIDAADVAAAERATKRTARLLREHPAVDGPRSHRGYDRRAYDCERCTIEYAAIRAAERATLAAEHTAGWHARPIIHPDAPGVCPWSCPNRTGY